MGTTYHRRNFLSCSFRTSVIKPRKYLFHEVKDESFISMNTGYGFRHLTDEFCKKAGFTPHIAFEVDEPTVISDLIKKGLGIAFVPSLTLLKNSTLASNKLRIIEPNCERTIGLSWSKKSAIYQTPPSNFVNS